MVLTKKEKKKLVIKLYEEGKTTREIAKIVKMSLRDIGIITRKYNHEPEPKPPKSDHSKAFKLFSKGKTPVEVAIIVDLTYDIVKKWYFEYLSLNNVSAFVDVIQGYHEFLPFFKEIGDKMKRGEMFKEDVHFLLANLIDWKSIFKRKKWLEHEVRCLELNKMN